MQQFSSLRAVQPLRTLIFASALGATLLSGSVRAQTIEQQLPWNTHGRNAQHTAPVPVASQSLNRIHWQTPVDLNPQYSGNDLLIHYGSPLVTVYNCVIVTVKVGAYDGFRIEGHDGGSGSLLWTQATDYTLPPHGWTPSVTPVITVGDKLYIPGAGGTVYYRNHCSRATTTTGQIVFYGKSNYLANPGAYQSTVYIDTPITADAHGNIFFGYYVTGSNPISLQSGIARISSTGVGTFVTAAAAANDSSIVKVLYNSAPALSRDGSILYVAVNDGGDGGYLLGLNSTTLATVYQTKTKLTDPGTGNNVYLDDSGTASPMVGTDGDVYFGVLENPFGYNHLRGWMLHFDSTLTTTKTPGAFGWDDTASLVPKTMVPSYKGTSPYLLMTKYNNYIEGGGDGKNKIAILSPDESMTDPISGVTVMKEVLTIVGPTPDPRQTGAYKEWCINSAAVDTFTKSILAGSEDGNLYRWDLTTNKLSQMVALTAGIGEAYTSTVVGGDGTVYAINNAILFAVGN